MNNHPLIRSQEGNILLLGNLYESSPKCSSCAGSMTHILRLDSTLSEVAKAKDGFLDVYQCCNEPGMCDDWDAQAGGNACYFGEAVNVDLQPKGVVALDSSRVINSFEAFCDVMESDDSCVGATGTKPVWIQDNETPTCSCGENMRFVAQVEEQAAENFNFGGGGVAYVFECTGCQVAKFLWQC